MSKDTHCPWIGVDVGGTTLRAGIVVGCEVVVEHRHAAHLSRHLHAGRPDTSLAYVVEQVTETVSRVRARYAAECQPTIEVAGVGLAMAGFFEPASGRIIHAPNLPGISDVNIIPPLMEALGLPVTAENDALAAAYGEWVLSDPRPESLVYVGLGTGVGGGLVVRGQPYRGQGGFAMEIGHLIVHEGGRSCGCGNRGCLEAYASATGVRQTFAESTGEACEAHEVARRAREGDPRAKEALDLAGAHLGTAVAHIMKVLDVPDVVIGGGMARSWDLLAPAFEARLGEVLIPALRGRVQARVSTSGDHAGMIGAAWLCRATTRG